MSGDSESEGPEPDEALNLFTGEPQHEKFHRLSELFPTSQLTASPEPHRFHAGPELSLPEAFEFDGITRSSIDFLAVDRRRHRASCPPAGS